MTALVVLTQAAEGSDSLAGQLSAAGLEVGRWPLVRLIPAAAQTIGPVLERLGDFNWVLILSPSAVRLVARRMKELGIAWPANVCAGLVGPASVEAFRDCFGDAPVIDTPSGPPHDARHLVEAIMGRQGLAPGGAATACARVLVLNRPDGRTQWLEALRQNAQIVEVVPAYTAEPVVEGPPADLMRRLQRVRGSGDAAHWVIGAGSQVDTLLQALPGAWAEWAKRQPVLVPHAAVLAHAEAAGFEDVRVYDDRRDLVERLQYLGSRHGPAPAEPADSDADNEELSVLTLDQQKDSEIGGEKPAGDQVAQTKLADTKPPATEAPSSLARVSTAVAPSSSAEAPSSSTALPPAAAAHSSSTAAPSSRPTPSSSTATPSSSVASADPAGAQALPPKPPAGSAAGPTGGKHASATPPRMPEPPPPAPPAPPSVARKRGSGAWALLLLLLVGLLAAGGWWYTQQRFLAAERESAHRVQEAEARAAKLEEQIRGLREAQNQLTSRSTLLEAKIAQSASQQEQLAGLYEEIARSRDEGALAEVEQSVTMANQHLQLTGNVQAALLALQNAERRLGESDQPQTTAARRLVAQDIERLKALPDVDVSRSAGRIDEIINRVDRLPLLADGDAAAPPAAPAPPEASPAAPAEATPAAPAEATAGAPAGSTTAAPADASPASSQDGEQTWWRRLYARIVQGATQGLALVKDELRSLVTIRRIDKPDVMLLSTEQKQAARDNLKLMLLNARLNLLNRHEELFRQDVGRAIESVQRLYDVEHQDVKTAISTLQSLQAQPLALNLPSLAESLGAVKAARAAVEKRS